MSTAQTDASGFWSFYREYAKTGIHAATAAALTLFGLLTRYHWGFLVVALAAYVLPLLHFYLADARGSADPAADEGRRAETAEGGTGREAGSGTEPRSRDGARSRDDRTGGAGSGGENAGSDGAHEGDVGAGTGTDAGVDTDTDTDSDDGDIDADTDADSDTDAGAEDTDPEDTDPDADNKEPPASAGAATGGGTSEMDTTPEWTVADAPTDATLNAATDADAGPYAVGDGGVVLARGDGEWESVVERGPSGDGNALRGVDATDDGTAVWYAGDSGALGRYDADRAGHADHSAPGDRTSTWTDVAVGGPAGEETVLLVNGSGVVLRGRYEGGSVRWGEAVKPGSGSSMAAATLDGADRGYLCDTSGTVYAVDGEDYEVIGVEDSGVAFTSVAAADGTVDAATTEGTVFRLADDVWTRQRVHEGPLQGIDRAGASGLACGDGGALYRLDEGWTAAPSLVDEPLYDVVAGGGTALAVGESGTILERPRR